MVLVLLFCAIIIVIMLLVIFTLISTVKIKINNLKIENQKKAISWRRIASTIRHNRARGTHQIADMSHIVLMLTENGWSEKEISKHLGMELDEIIRLKQMTGLKDMFANHKFSKSWEEFEVNMKEKAIHRDKK